VGNYRALVIMAGELLAAAARRGLDRLDEKLYLELYATPGQAPEPPKPRRTARRRR
jgi:hypothetical protein